MNLARSDDFIINGINDRNSRANNRNFYNVIECGSNWYKERIHYNIEQVKNVINSTPDNTGNVSLLVKVIHLGRYQFGKIRSSKAIFTPVTHVFDVLKNKNKHSLLNPLSPIIISIEQTQYQRDFMKT